MSPEVPLKKSRTIGCSAQSQNFPTPMFDQHSCDFFGVVINSQHNRHKAVISLENKQLRRYA